MSAPDDAQVLARTRRWLERAVIGLNLCPFARGVVADGRVRWTVSPACDVDALLAALQSELRLLQASDPQQIDTTLLIHPQVLTDFLDYNDFLDLAEAALVALDLDGEFQIASFHPQYRFAGSAEDDVAHCTNRSPYPMLHLLRQASVARAVAAFPDASRIYAANIETLRRLGWSGWQRLLADD
jgi:hypothetical protein